ncbi:alcohol dehydrogenase catalytic domain-containing protein [Lactiplantibacillus plantarum]|nr:alcohol dehydrogenase catalytic domain-containing protein [Lactiplantibacillus plantarum]MCM2629215.1 alcohol dehydrogenase catalytic domain-containing protein [Lactiplantibacillus plantarum]
MQALVVPDPSAQTMKQLQWQERPMPNLGPTEVLIKTQAVGLNPVDFKLVTAGNAAWQYPHTLGLDTAGIVEAVGAEVTNFRPGERVCGHANLANNGTFAEYVSLPAAVLAKIPTTVSFEAAAASLCAGLTLLARPSSRPFHRPSKPSWHRCIPMSKSITIMKM